MDETRMKEIVGKLDDDQKNTLRTWAENIDKDPRELIQDFCEQYERDIVESLPDDERIRWAMKVVDNHIANELQKPTEWIEVYLFGIDPAHDSEKRPGKVYGIGAVPNVKEPKEITVRAWQGDKKIIDQLSTGEAYRIKASRQSKITDKVDYDFTAQSKIEESDFLEGKKNDEIERLIQRFYKRTLIKDAERNVSKKGDFGDFRMVKGMVQGHLIKTNDDGDTTCMLFLRDGSIPHQEVEPNSAMTVFVPEQMMRYGTDSELIVIGTISHNPNSEYGPSMNSVGIIPLIPTPLETDPSSVDESTIEVEDADDVVVSDEDVEDDLDDLI